MKTITLARYLATWRYLVTCHIKNKNKNLKKLKKLKKFKKIKKK